jgi:hypothetical protein
VPCRPVLVLACTARAMPVCPPSAARSRTDERTRTLTTYVPQPSATRSRATRNTRVRSLLAINPPSEITRGVMLRDRLSATHHVRRHRRPALRDGAVEPHEGSHAGPHCGALPRGSAALGLACFPVTLDLVALGSMRLLRPAVVYFSTSRSCSEPGSFLAPCASCWWSLASGRGPPSWRRCGARHRLRSRHGRLERGAPVPRRGG